jgi:DNA-binding PadR family transcriptional regulator
MIKSADVLPGTVDMLILQAVALEHQGLVESAWGQSENGRRARFYTITPAGRRRLKAETAGWNRLTAAIAAALSATPDEVH